MKICAIICEFNPFHNGHKYLIERAKTLSHCDRILCIMSGSFTQRGEICVLDKYVRARHAILGGADAVLELPAEFSVAPAEIFAQGAIKILSSIPEVCALAFGCENGVKEDFLTAARIAANESLKFKEVLRINLENGDSFIKSYENAFVNAGGKSGFISEPNNILGLEYTKAILQSGSDIEILPIKRLGADYNDKRLIENFSSASAIRANPRSPLVKENVPDFVYSDLSDFSITEKRYGDYLRLILTRTDAQALTRVYGCSEGLENKLKKLENLSVEKIIAGATSKRYPSARIKRILCANFLGLNKTDCEEFLSVPLYLKPLAINKNCANAMLAAIAKSVFPVITSGTDAQKLNETAQKCLKKDEFAFNQWQIIAQKQTKDNMILI